MDTTTTNININSAEFSNKMKALFVISNAGFSDDIMETARATGLLGATIIHARGSGAIKSFLGITVDTEKEIIFSIINEEIAEKVMLAIKEKHGMTTPAHSICFLMPVDKTVGMPTAQSAQASNTKNFNS